MRARLPEAWEVAEFDLKPGSIVVSESLDPRGTGFSSYMEGDDAFQLMMDLKGLLLKEPSASEAEPHSDFMLCPPERGCKKGSCGNQAGVKPDA